MPDTENIEAPKVAATLFIPDTQVNAVKVVGRSGKPYPFKRRDGVKRGVYRDYTSAEVFAKEELDIRKNRNNPHPVCTLLGEADPIANAKEAVKTLVNSGRSIMSDKRRVALADILALAGPAYEALNEVSYETVPDTESESGIVQIVVEPIVIEPVVIESVTLESEELIAQEVVQPIVETVVAQDFPPTDAPITDYTEQYLADTLAWGAFRKLANDEFNVSGGSRKEMVAEVLKIQSERKGAA